MPITANGTTYTATTTTLSNGDRALVTVADGLRGGYVPMAVYTHGNGGPFNQFYTDSVWKPLRDWLIDSGWAFCECDGAGDNWGGNASRTSYELCVAWAKTVLRVNYLAVIGRSMGDLVAYWLATFSNFAADVIGFISNSGTTDLAYRYSVATGPDLAEMNAAYGVPGTVQDIPTFTANSAGHDPMLFPTTAWVGKKVLQLGGDADTTVPYNLHGGAWWAKYGSSVVVPPSGFAIQPGGTHTGPINSYQQVTEMVNFLTAILPVTPIGIPLPIRRVFYKENGRFKPVAVYPMGVG